MFDLPVDALLASHRMYVVETPPLVEIPSHAEAVSPPAPTPEHVAAVDGAFLRERHEQDAIAGLLGLRLSVLLLHDLARDAAPSEDEEEQSAGAGPQPSCD